MEDVLQQTGIRFTCGIGTNLYLAKIALDILAKHAEDYIGYLDENLYRKTLWQHRPLTDFWRIGPGIAGKLANYGITTMEGINGCRFESEPVIPLSGAASHHSLLQSRP